MQITRCKGEGQGSCKGCSDKGIWNRHWMTMLYKVEGLEGCYCSRCIKEMREGIKKPVVPADKEVDDGKEIYN